MIKIDQISRFLKFRIRFQKDKKQIKNNQTTYSKLGVRFHVEGVLLFHILGVEIHKDAHTENEDKENATRNAANCTTIQATLVLEHNSRACFMTELVAGVTSVCTVIAVDGVREG